MKKHPWLLLIILMICGILTIPTANIAYHYYQYTHIDPAELWETALANIEQRTSHRYALTSALQLNNYAMAKSTIAGEKDNNGNLHVWGEIMDTDMELYQFGTTCYRYQEQTNAWKVKENHPLTDQALLCMELLPETNFTLLKNTQGKYQGRKIEGGKIYYIYTLNQQGGDFPSASYYENFSYKIYIEAKNQEIVKAIITANGKANPKNTIVLKVKFSNINESFTLTPPK